MALVICSPAGSVSPTVIALCAGLVPPLVNVKASVVLLPSEMEAAPKFLVTKGGPAMTVTQLGAITLLTTAIPLILPAELVNAAGFPAQLAFIWPTALVICTSMLHVACPLGIVAPVTTMLDPPLVAAVTVAALAQVDEPKTPAEAIRSPAGNESVKLIPLRAGLVPEFVRVNRNIVVEPSTNVDGVKVLVKFS